MRIDPVLRALRSDPAPQHAAQASIREALEGWRGDPAVRATLDEVVAYGAGAAFDTCPRLAELLSAEGHARGFAAALVRRFAPVLAAEPLARMPFRQSSQATSANLLLAKSGRAILSLAVRAPDGDARDAGDQDIAGFADGERRDLVLAGAGAGEMVRMHLGDDERPRFERRRIPLGAGSCLSLAMSEETLFLTSVSQALVTLRLVRLADRPRPSREYRLSDGVLLGQAAGDPRASRHEMMLALLGRMGRSDAAPLLAEMAGDGCEHLRWQALRECLALDTAAGFGALSAIARDPADPLAAPAGALRAQLLEAHPQLANLEEGLSCRA